MRALIIVWSKSWDLCEPLRRVGVETEILGPVIGSRAVRRRWALRILRKNMREFDVVISAGSGLIGLLATRAARRQGCIAAINLRGDPWQESENQLRQGTKSRLRAWFDSWASTRSVELADLVIPVSHTLKEWAIERTGCDPSRMAVVPIPVDLNRFPPSHPAERPPEWNHSCTISLATWFALRQKIEGIQRFLPVLRAVVENYDAGVVIAGKGPLHEEFMETNKDLLDHPAIYMPGYVDDMPSLYHWSDIVCHFSFLDGCPAVPLEAWASGLPVVVNDFPPLVENLVPGTNGHVLPNDASVDDCLPVFDRLIRDAEYRRELGQNGRRLIEKEFTPEVVGARLLRAIEDARDSRTG